MKIDTRRKKYVPGTYVKRRPDAAELSENYILEWEEKRLEVKKEQPRPDMPPTICFSRKIGVGAFEIADILAEKTGYRIVDREILEHIANQAKLSEKTVALFDERYPGEIGELLSLAFGEKAFIKSDYTRHLFRTILSIAGLGPTIFVGRGVHMLLPREQVLAVRFIASKEHRINRLARIFDIKEEEAASKLDHMDKEQRDFFKKVYGKKDASPYEFDLVINCDFISDPKWAAEIVALAFREKLGSEAATT
ncbi:MAG: cytidylate kinase-like family protein [Desulfobacteraceae bacterium]|nr:MAG: cytidylate kinase-like family protein [Desulfobacteraceae bacterium]